MSPAGMEPAGAERHRRSPKGERAGASESIEPTLHVATKLANLLARRAVSPAGIEPTSAHHSKGYSHLPERGACGRQKLEDGK